MSLDMTYKLTAVSNFLQLNYFFSVREAGLNISGRLGWDLTCSSGLRGQTATMEKISE